MNPGTAYLIAEDVVLLSHDPVGTTTHTWPPVLMGGDQTDLSLMGAALLADLVGYGLVQVVPGGTLRKAKIVVAGAAPPDPLLAEAMRRVEPVARTPLEAGRWLGAGVRQQCIERLVQRGALRTTERKLLGVRRTSATVVDTARHHDVGQAVVDVLQYRRAPDVRTFLMAAILVHGTDVGKRLPALAGAERHQLVAVVDHLRSSPDPAISGLVRSGLLDVCLQACSEPRRSGGDDGDWDLV